MVDPIRIGLLGAGWITRAHAHALHTLDHVTHLGRPIELAALAARNPDKGAAMACLEKVGMSGFADRQISQLSGGQQQRVAVRFAQLAEGGVKVRSDLFPSGIGFGGKQLIHGGGFLFADATAHFGANGFGGEIPRRAMQPPSQYGAAQKLSGIGRQGHKRALRHIFRQMRIANDA